MKCTICKNGETNKGLTTVTLERNGSLIVFNEVPADICDNCGEAYFSLETTQKLELLADEAIKKAHKLRL